MGLFTKDAPPKLTKRQAAEQKTKFQAIQAWADGATDDQLAGADPARLAPSYGLDAVTVGRVIAGERDRRRQMGDR
jgi:hypothetical protein